MLATTACVYVYVNKNINSNQHLTHARSKIRVACSARTAILPLCLATPPAVVKLSRTYTQMASNSPLHYSPLLSLLFSQHSAGPSVIHHLCNISRGRYVYMQDLQALSGPPPVSSASLAAPVPPLQLLSLISTPLQVRAWANLLNGHPDSEFALFILQGLQQGFRIGFQGPTPLTSPRRVRNMRSAYDHPEVIESYLAREVGLQRIISIPHHLAPSFPSLRLSPFGVIPKRNQSNKWRLIVDLSSPEGRSVNDGIDPNLCSIKYASVDDAVNIIQRLGRGTLLAKLDLRDAYRIVPVHPNDRPLLGMQWRDSIYIDTALPFGLRSAPKIFSALADALLWILQFQGASPSLHYLDDFLLIGSPNSSNCSQALQTTLDICKVLGVPIAEEKTEGPVTSLTFLGIEIDTDLLQLRLPSSKLNALSAMLSSWCSSCPRRKMLCSGHQAGSAISDGPPQSCSYCGQTGVHFYPKPHRCLILSQIP